MEKRNTIAHFFGAAALIILAVFIFKVIGGDIPLERFRTDNGMGVMQSTALNKLTIYFGLVLSGFCAVIFALTEDDMKLKSWIASTVIIAIALLITGIIDLQIVAAGIMIIGLLIFWIVFTIKAVGQVFYDYDQWIIWVIAICRVVCGITILSLALVWTNLPFEPNNANVLTQDNISALTGAGIACIVGAIAFIAEAVIWLKFIDE